jgi:hypothetical protein
MVSVPRSNSDPLIPPAGSFTVSSTNHLAETGQITHKFPDEAKIIAPDVIKTSGQMRL